MSENQHHNVRDGLHHLQDDGGRALPTTPEALLSRAKRTKRQHRVAALTATACAAFAVLGGVAYAQSSGTSPLNSASGSTVQQSVTPGSATSPDAATLKAANKAVTEALFDKDEVPGKINPKPRFRSVLTGAPPYVRGAKVLVPTVSGKSVDSARRTADDALKASGHSEVEVLFDTGASQADQLYFDVIARTEELRASGMPVYVVGGGVNGVQVQTEGDINAARQAYASFGPDVQIEHVDRVEEQHRGQ